jgi:CspA family cold shock protein
MAKRLVSPGLDARALVRGVVAMAQGVIKRIVLDRGFGFISGSGQDVFFHHSTVEGAKFDDLQEGQSVEYEVETGEGRGKGKGPRASVVRPV